NSAPTLSEIGNQSVNEGENLSLTVTATDPDGGGLIFSLAAGAPQGAGIDPVSGHFSWTPGEQQGPGTFEITVQVTEQANPALVGPELGDAATFSVTVNEVNQPPLLEPIDDQSVQAGQTLTLQLRASDADRPSSPLRFELGEDSPEGAALDPITGVFTFTPADSTTSQTHQVTVLVREADESALSDSQSFRIHVIVPNQDTESVLFADDFNDNVINQEQWSYGRHSVTETDGIMQVSTTKTDQGGYLRSRLIEIDGQRPITVSRRTQVHYGNEYFAGDFRIKTYADESFHSSFGVSYANYTYSSSKACPAQGFFVYGNDANITRCQSGADVSDAIDPVWDQWIDEEIVFDPSSGIMKYSIDGEQVAQLDVGSLPAAQSYQLQLQFGAWGWWTGHYQYADDLVVSQAPSPASHQVKIRPEITDLEGNPVDNVIVGEQFLASIYVEDLREQADGVFAAFLDLEYDPQQISIAGPIVFGESFSSFQSGDATTPGLIDEVGGIAGIETLGDGEYLLFSVPFRADAAGIVALAANPADDLPLHDVLLFGDNSATSLSEIDYGIASVSMIVNQLPSAVADELTIVHVASPSTLDVLANDSDPDGDRLSIIAVTSANQGGSVVVNEDGTALLYTPAAGFVGFETFTYTVSDGKGGTSEANATIQVLNPWHQFCLVPTNDVCVPEDVNGDGLLTPLDALLVINQLNATGGGPLAVPREPATFYSAPDVDNNGQLTPLDALLVINLLNAAVDDIDIAAGEGEATTPLLPLLAGAGSEYSNVASPGEPAADDPLDFSFASDRTTLQRDRETSGTQDRNTPTLWSDEADDFWLAAELETSIAGMAMDVCEEWREN
ncbi:MAG: Ig-like domain-containing protein, partial [Pirellulaceae bacterium]